MWKSSHVSQSSSSSCGGGGGIPWWECCIPEIKIQSGSICSPRNTPSTHHVFAYSLPLPLSFSLSSTQHLLLFRRQPRQQHRGEEISSSLVFFLPPRLAFLLLSPSPLPLPFPLPSKLVPVLYVSGLGQVGDEGHNHPHVHPRSNGDGKRGQE